MGTKRKREALRPTGDVESVSSSQNESDYEIVPETDYVDIASALTAFPVEDSDDDLEDLIRSHQEKQNVKAGTQTVKRAIKGQSKLGTSAVGGGSFQNMGEYYMLPFIYTI